jgi:hypothetical protein
VGDEKNKENRRSAIFGLLNNPPKILKPKSYCVIEAKIRRSLENDCQQRERRFCGSEEVEITYSCSSD